MRDRSSADRRGAADLLAGNLPLKVLALLLALGIYAFTHSAQNAHRTLPVDLVALVPPAAFHKTLMTVLPSSVRVTLRGPRAVLDELRADDLGTVQVDLQRGTETQVRLDPSTFHVPPGVGIEQIDPPFLDLRWEDVVTRAVPIQASVTGQPAAGFTVKGPPRVEPAFVQARGPRSLVDVIQHARAEAFDVSALGEGTHERLLPLDRPAPRVVFATSAIAVKVDIGRDLLERVFTNVPVLVVGGARGTATPAGVDVRVVGAPDKVRALRPEQILPRADLAAAGAPTGQPGSATIIVTVEVEGCEAHATPKIVVVKW